MQIRSSDGAMVTLNTDGSIIHNTHMLDAGQTIFFQRELEHIKAKTFEVEYADLTARTLFPVSNEVGEGVDTIVYRVFDKVGMAEIINTQGKDLPRADVFGKEVKANVVSSGISFGYTLSEIQASSRVGKNLEQRKANAGVRGQEELINEIAFFGNAENDLIGLFSHPNIPTGNVPDGASASPLWSNKTPAEILFDVNNAFADIYESTKMKERGNTLLLPVVQWSQITTTARSENSDVTVAEFLVKNSPFLTSVNDIIAVNELAGAGTGGEDVLVAYNRNPEKLELDIPSELKWLPVQVDGLEFEVPGHARIAGLNVYVPLSAKIMEGI